MLVYVFACVPCFLSTYKPGTEHAQFFCFVLSKTAAHRRRVSRVILRNMLRWRNNATPEMNPDVYLVCHMIPPGARLVWYYFGHASDTPRIRERVCCIVATIVSDLSGTNYASGKLGVHVLVISFMTERLAGRLAWGAPSTHAESFTFLDVCLFICSASNTWIYSQNWFTDGA